MEERQEPKGHKLIMGERSCLQMTGINDVVSFDAGEIILETACGPTADQRQGTAYEPAVIGEGRSQCRRHH